MNLSETTLAQVRALLAENRKIEAIKLIRSELGVSLRQAVDLLQAMEKGKEVSFQVYQKDPRGRMAARGGDRTISIVSTIFVGVAVVLLSIAVGVAWDTNTVITHSQRVTGRVVDFAEHRKGYMPVVEYTYNGQKRQISGGVISNPPSYELGEEVGLYIPNDSSLEPLIDSITGLWMVPLILGFIAFVFLFIGGVSWIVSR